MADKPSAELDQFAFEIYKTAIASSAAKRGGDRIALDAYRKAEEFLAVREKIRTGALTPAKAIGPQLAECCCPNLPAGHPHNLVARTHTDRKTGVVTQGDMGKVNRIAGFLTRNPPSADRPESEIAEAVNREFSGLSWSENEVRTARALLPAYASKEAKN